MRQAILTRLRSVDSHPLAAALAGLLLVVALIGGVHAGGMAAASGSDVPRVLCSQSTGGADQHPGDQRADLCCVAGCLAHAPALDAPPLSAPAPRFAGGVTTAHVPAATLSRAEAPREHRPRGPPSFA